MSVNNNNNDDDVTKRFLFPPTAISQINTIFYLSMDGTSDFLSV